MKTKEPKEAKLERPTYDILSFFHNYHDTVVLPKMNQQSIAQTGMALGAHPTSAEKSVAEKKTVPEAENGEKSD